MASEVLQKHKSSIIHLFAIIHSMSEHDKKVLETFVTFTRNEVCGTQLVFFKRGDFKVSYLKF